MKSRLLLIALLASLTSFGQDISCDIIEKKNGELIEAKILEVGIRETKYKMCDYTRGPTLIIRNNEIFQIKYSNGNINILNIPFEKEDFLFEISLGLNFAKAEYTDNLIRAEVDADFYRPYRLLGNIGLIGSKKVTNYINYKIGVNYSIRGFAMIEKDIQSHLVFPGPGESVGDPGVVWGVHSGHLMVDYKLHYLSNQQLIGFNISDHIELYTGVEISYLLFDQYQNHLITNYSDADMFPNIMDLGNSTLGGIGYSYLTEATSKFDFGIMSGLSLKTKRIKSSLNMYFGLRSIWPKNFIDSSGNSINPTEMTNRVISLNVAYLLKDE